MLYPILLQYLLHPKQSDIFADGAYDTTDDVLIVYNHLRFIQQFITNAIWWIDSVFLYYVTVYFIFSVFMEIPLHNCNLDNIVPI
jgi:hypothetical protein